MKRVRPQQSARRSKNETPQTTRAEKILSASIA